MPLPLRPVLYLRLSLMLFVITFSLDSGITVSAHRPDDICHIAEFRRVVWDSTSFTRTTNMVLDH